MSASAWAPVGPARLGLYSSGPAAPAANDSGLTALATPSEGANRAGRPFSLENPLLAILGVGAVTLGLIAFSTSGAVSVRLGKATATVGGGAGVGSTK